MTTDISKTQHFTTQAESICANLVEYIPKDAKLIEPFVGNGDLLNLFPNHSWLTYDIDPQNPQTIQQDTLLNPPNYKNHWVITNPPYLARNKATDKTLFDKYHMDDLYKIALRTLLEANGGIVIIPINFFTDERSSAIRIDFLSKFKILELNIYTEPVFDSTTYSVCAFAFERKGSTQQTIPTNVLPRGEKVELFLDEAYGFRLAGDFFNELSSVAPRFGRLVKDRDNLYPTNIRLYAIDNRYDKIRLEYNDDRYVGSSSDRTMATLTCDIELTEEQQRYVVNEFNRQLGAFREEYFDLALTNYRDFGRKRIGFDFAYRLATRVVETL